jgi:hypothetical protein
MVVEPRFNRPILYGTTAAGAIIPVKVVDDGSGHGKLSVAAE